MKKISIVTGLLMLLLVSGCKEDWDKHYNDQPETIDRNLWEAIQEDDNLTLFVQAVKEFQFDTLFQKDDAWTIFIPDNDAFSSYLDTAEVNQALLEYLISPAFVQTVMIEGKRKVQTLGEKFALFKRQGSDISIDDVPVTFESPLYRNGKYFILQAVTPPKLSLYEYIAQTNTALKMYIDSKDSVILDKEKSRPIGFDENGNTIYDSVAIIFNKFEYKYFPVSEEFRNKTATLVFPKQEDYNNALTEMAQQLSDIYQDYKDIPDEWQQNSLIPYLLERGVFENMMEPEEFIPKYTVDTLKLKNILGDSINIPFGVKEKTICSNGYAYNYDHFSVPDTLFRGIIRFEPEHLVRMTGIDKFSWKDSVTVISDLSFPPSQQNVKSASGDSILSVKFSPGYEGRFSVSFKVKNLFPRRYLMVFRTQMVVGGIYDIYVNDNLVRTFDYADFLNYRSYYLPSVIPGKGYVPEPGNYHRFDCWAQSDVPYGFTTVRLEYMGPTSNPDVPTVNIEPGLLLDYIDFIPYD